MHAESNDNRQLRPLKAPFPWFGGKSKAAELVWSRLGRVKQYLEPFYGSGAVHLACPEPASLEVIGDADHYVANFWRAVQNQPADVARWADQPVVHVELTARHAWLVQPERVAELRARLMDADWPGDARIAGWWVWGLCSWIGSGWCAGGASDKIPHVSDAGRGVQRGSLRDQIPHVSDAGMGVGKRDPIADMIDALSERLRHTRVINGDWSRCLNMHYGTSQGGIVGVFLDPPYKAYEKLYGQASPVACDVEAWARENGDRPEVRIALAGHLGDYDLPGWNVVAWKRGGLTYGSAKTTDKEAIWFSPHCLQAEAKQLGLFAG